MAEYAKELPSELRFKSPIASASAHQDLLVPAIGSSNSAKFRSLSKASDIGSQSDEYHSFVNGDAQYRDIDANAEAPRDAASIIASSWTGQDLAPREGDGAAVIELLDNAGSLDDLDESLDELHARREQDWQVGADNATPQDPVSASSVYSKIANPYLYNLLSLPEDQSIASYLDSSTYTDDVWGLPLSLKQDLDRAKGLNGTTPDAKDKALRRLAMLKDHLGAKAGNQAKSTAPFEASDWDAIWNSRIA